MMPRGKRKTHEEYIKEVDILNNGINVVGIYQGNGIKILHQCINGHIWEVTPLNILNRHGCPVCSGHKACIDNCLATVNPELASEWHSSKNNKLTPYDVLPKSNKKVWWVCGICGCEWKASIDHRSNGTGCINCFKKIISIKLKKSHDEYLNELHQLNISIKPIEKYKGANEKILHQCENSHAWMVSPNKILHGRGCPECSESKGEKRIRIWLTENNIDFEPQKEFNGLIGLGGKNLSYDFYLPDYKLLIEYQGIQHEKYINCFHKNKYAFVKQKEHDKRKKDYADSHNIRLLEIWYWDYENIENILSINN